MDVFFYDYDDFDHTTALVDWFETELVGEDAGSEGQQQVIVNGNRQSDKTRWEGARAYLRRTLMQFFSLGIKIFFFVEKKTLVSSETYYLSLSLPVHSSCDVEDELGW